MNISLLTPKFALNKDYQANNNFRYNNPVGHSKLKTLNADTVSFTSLPKSAMTLADYLEARVAADSDRLKRIATVYLDVLESVAFKLKDKGFSFDRAYCELNPVKSASSYVSKIKRSKTFKVPDTIRATIYCSDPYDLSKLSESLLPEMAIRGYVVAPTEVTVKDLLKRGYLPSADETVMPLEKMEALKKVIPDLDIRLEDVSSQISKLPESLKYSVGKPQKSGYEDIQIRFVRNFDTKGSPTQHELIVLFGPNYANAKHRESEMVYSHLRKLNELNMLKYAGTEKYESAIIRPRRYRVLLEQMFRGKVSEKEFINAKNKDYAQIADEIPISFSEIDETLLRAYFKELMTGINNTYAVLMKGSKRKDALKQEMKADKAILSEIHRGLKNTIAYYKKAAQEGTK